jgi:hypothetical protein
MSWMVLIVTNSDKCPFIKSSGEGLIPDGCVHKRNKSRCCNFNDCPISFGAKRVLKAEEL